MLVKIESHTDLHTVVIGVSLDIARVCRSLPQSNLQQHTAVVVSKFGAQSTRK